MASSLESRLTLLVRRRSSTEAVRARWDDGVLMGSPNTGDCWDTVSRLHSTTSGSGPDEYSSRGRSSVQSSVDAAPSAPGLRRPGEAEGRQVSPKVVRGVVGRPPSCSG